MSDESQGDRTARLSGSAAWLIALISAGAALLGALVGAASGYLVAERQISAAREDALRAERKEAYAEGISALSLLQLTVRKAAALEEATAAEVDALVCPQVESARQSLLPSLLVGSEDASLRANDALGVAASWCTTALGRDTTREDTDDLVTSVVLYVSAAQRDLAD